MEFLTIAFFISFAVFLLVLFVPVLILGSIPVAMLQSLGGFDISLPHLHHHRPIAQH